MKTIDDDIRIPVLENGDKLWHYTSAEGLKGISEGEFWATECGFMNDQMEFQIATDIICEVIENHMSDMHKCGHIQNKVREEIDRVQASGLRTTDDIGFVGSYVISFCLECDSQLMWSTYSNYTGYCIQFDFEKLITSLEIKEDSGRFIHGMVVYNHEDQIRIVEDAIKACFFDWPTGFDYLNKWEDFDKLSDKEIDEFSIFIVLIADTCNKFFKLPCFEGEHEYRFVFMRIHDGGRVTKDAYTEVFFRIKEDVFIPYIKVDADTKKSIERIIIGAKNQSDIAENGVLFFFRNLKHDVVVSRSSVPVRY